MAASPVIGLPPRSNLGAYGTPWLDNAAHNRSYCPAGLWRALGTTPDTVGSAGSVPRPPSRPPAGAIAPSGGWERPSSDPGAPGGRCPGDTGGVCPRTP